jgi:hypothetical protein
MLQPEDAKLLRDCLEFYSLREQAQQLDDNEERHRDAFQDMIDRWRHLTPTQRSYVRGVHERLNLGVHYENAWSAGKVPRGKALATPVPEVLLRPLPKRPPGRV